ncbi:aspartate 1-decarboxylase [Thermotoga sp. 38H-to]|uniref:aspartate 1-decarboxylase n=1 Tax=Thermotoga sp. 38H-to TaxID=1755812 RepID=UPI0013ECD761|nr:aspartate 1-decarboxylase [Thermotoga sp. 38H-to]KAF2959096.1 aspartate decarboxylase [Thermotoga sp. 38H-to]
MLNIYLKSKIHMAKITRKEVYYEGSIEIDEELMEKAGISEGELVLVVNVNNAERFVTYVIKGKRGSREINLYGAAARLGEEGDRVIIMAFTFSDKPVKAKTIVLNEKNEIVQEK